MKKISIFTIIIISVILGIIIGISIMHTITQETEEIKGIKGEINLIVPAIDGNTGKGVTGILTTTLKQGSGLVLVNINDVLAGYDTQYSARTAAHAASNYTNIDLKDLDVIYNIKINASAVEGTSAGSAMAISAIALLENKTLNPKVTITGTISEDGSIGRVSAIPQKAEASKEEGIDLFLIPEQSSLEGNYVKQKVCKTYDNKEYCEIKYIQEEDEITISGIKTKKVKNLEEAMKYFYEQ